MKPVLEYYQKNSYFVNQPYENNDVYQVNIKIESAFAKQDVKPVRMVPVHFLLGNDAKEINSFAIKLSKRFGMLGWSLEELIT